jgi:hypothetical protein
VVTLWLRSLGDELCGWTESCGGALTDLKVGP